MHVHFVHYSVTININTTQVRLHHQLSLHHPAELEQNNSYHQKFVRNRLQCIFIIIASSPFQAPRSFQCINIQH